MRNAILMILDNKMQKPCNPAPDGTNKLKCRGLQVYTWCKTLHQLCTLSRIGNSASFWKKTNAVWENANAVRNCSYKSSTKSRAVATNNGLNPRKLGVKVARVAPNIPSRVYILQIEIAEYNNDSTLKRPLPLRNMPHGTPLPCRGGVPEGRGGVSNFQTVKDIQTPPLPLP